MRAIISGSNETLQRYGHSKLSKMAACRQIGFDVTGNSAIRSVDPENPTPEARTKHEVYRITPSDTVIQNFPRWRTAAILDLI